MMLTASRILGGTGSIYPPNGVREGIYAPSTTQFFDFVAALPPPLGGTIVVVMAEM